jgi:hypothetical protein
MTTGLPSRVALDPSKLDDSWRKTSVPRPLHPNNKTHLDEAREVAGGRYLAARPRSTRETEIHVNATETFCAACGYERHPVSALPRASS